MNDTYELPANATPDPVGRDEVVLIASGDLRHAANQMGWPAQVDFEVGIAAVLHRLGRRVKRAHAYDDTVGHGFISSQRMGMRTFQTIDPDAPLIVAEAVWQYSHHVLAGP